MALTAQPYFDLLLGDREVAGLLGIEADIAAMLSFEAALSAAEAECGLIDKAAAEAIQRALAGFVPDMQRLTDATLKDGVPVPDLVQQIREAVGGDHGASVHYGATSQDVVDTAMALKLKPVFDLFDSRLGELDVVFADLLARFGDVPLMARSRMQAAIMITAGDRIAVWRKTIARVRAELPAQREAMLVLSLAGAAGTSEKFGDAVGAVRQAISTRLGLCVPDYVPHTDRGRIADFANFLSRITGALGKLGQDAALMSQNGIGQIAIAGAGGSSAMPHKQNPVRAEVLVTLARYNAGQLSLIHQALIHEQERSGGAWTLEWLVLPQMIEAAAAAICHATSMLSAVERMGEPG